MKDFMTGEHWKTPYESNCPLCHCVDHCVCHGRVCPATGPHNGNGRGKRDQHYYQSDWGGRHRRFVRLTSCQSTERPPFDPLAQTLGTSSTALLAVELQRLMRTL